MNNITRFIKTTVAGGIIFLVPIVILLLILEKALGVSRKLMAPVEKLFPGMAAEHRVLLIELIAITFLIAVCFIAGLCAKMKWGKAIIQKVEDAILSKIPGYSFFKTTGEGLIGLEQSEKQKVVIAMYDDAWQIGFLIEECDNDTVAVFLPDAPSPWSGSVVIFKKEQIKHTDLSANEAFSIMRQMGKGVNKLFKRVL